MLSSVLQRLVSRIAAALVALALSGIGTAAAEISLAPGGHACRCPKADHDCTCPTCRAGAAARRGTSESPPCHRPRSGAADGGADLDLDAERRCITSACHLPEVAAALEGPEVFTVPGTAWLCVSPPAERVVSISAAPRRLARPPEVPPPRSGRC